MASVSVFARAGGHAGRSDLDPFDPERKRTTIGRSKQMGIPGGGQVSGGI